MLELETDGKKVIQEVYFKEQIYHEPLMDLAPDLFLVPWEGYDLKSSIKKAALTTRSQLIGMHTSGDAVVYANAGISGICREGPLKIGDIFPTVVAAIGLRPEETVEGKDLLQR